MKLNIVVEPKLEQKTNLIFNFNNKMQDVVYLDKLCFSVVDGMSPKTITGAEFGLKQGSYIEVVPIGELTLQPDDIWQFTLTIDGVINQYTDLPATVFGVYNDEIVEIEYTKSDKIAACGIAVKSNDVEVIIGISTRPFNCFPTPLKISNVDGYVDLSGGFALDVCDEFKTGFECAKEIEADFKVDDLLFKLSDDGVLLKIEQDMDMPSESYKLHIFADKVEVSARDLAGIHNAFMSLWQMASLNPRQVACVEIYDTPRFEWRGQHLDVARQFFSVDEVKRFINLMSLYKLNKFHWHLVDDEAWRVEILALPQLTQKISTRGYGQMIEPLFGSGMETSGGFYTQQDMRDIVEYAAKRNVEVIPEIDIPGHCYALIKAMPELVEEADMSEYKSVQNYEDNCLNPALPETYAFIDKVFTEVSEIFASDYIHIGADERPHGSWEKSPKVAELMSQNGFNSTEQVQAYFINKVQAIAKKYGKKVGAWEEATEQGDIAKDGYIVSWKGVEAGIDAAERGYSVVMSPAQYCYFDIAQSTDFDEPGLTWTGGRVSMKETYNYEPIPHETSAKVAEQFKGIQGCLWSENLYDKSILDHMMFPRMIALSEICWVGKDAKNFAEFKADLKKWQRPLLDALGVKFRQRDFV